MRSTLLRASALALTAAAFTGCTVIINGANLSSSRPVGTLWSGTDIAMVPSEPDHYTGQLRVYDADGSSHPEGFGTYTKADGSVLQGNFHDGLLDGHGTLRYPSGWTEEGAWKGGDPDGDMTVTAPDGTDALITYKDGKKIHEHGTVVYDDKTRQTGDWDDVLERGKGAIDYPDGRHYQGEWRDISGAPDLPDGDGAMTWPDGRRYTGAFRDGQPQGAGTMTTPNAPPQTGLWKNGSLITPAHNS
ncbi:MAG TPA: hypothetical protein VHQ47_21045 [Phycisphaerae bacterium]|nr:hypothetical protein [Phycisphaerae bacterium]